MLQRIRARASKEEREKESLKGVDEDELKRGPSRILGYQEKIHHMAEMDDNNLVRALSECLGEKNVSTLTFRLYCWIKFSLKLEKTLRLSCSG